MKIFAFEGFRYTGLVGDPGSMSAPPFDQISDALRDELHARSPFQYAHFTRPVEVDGATPYESAAAVHTSWVEAGAVAREETPCLYPYLVVAPSGSRRASLCCVVAVGTTTSSDLRPHELTVEKPLADRLALLRTTQIDPEPVMIVAEDDGALEEMLREDVSGQAPLVETTDEEGNRHALYRITDAARIAVYRDLLSSRTATIADGHHRSKTAQLYAQEVGAPEGVPASTKMAVLISSSSEALTIDPIHRAIRGALDEEAMAGCTVARAPFEGGNGAALAAAVARSQGPAIGVWLRPGDTQVWRLDESAAPATTPRKARSLSVVLLHHLLLPAAGVGLEAAVEGTILYRSDPDELYRMIAEGQVASGFWLPPMAPQKFAEAVSEGDVLPPKSTRFMPKLISGMVWAPHDGRLL
jgi:uncharacterized protein (DUF1015 family)